MGWLGNFFSDPWNAMLDVPGSPEAVTQSVVDGSGSDGLSWNPFYQEGPSVWDRGALGYKLSDQDQEREHGRMFGRAVAAYGTGGYSEMALSPAEVKSKGGSDKDALRAGAKAYALAGANNYLGSYDAAGGMGVDNPVYKGAINGALSSGATTAIGGGNSTQIGQSMVKGGIGGGLDGYRGGNMDYEENGYSRAPWAQTRDNSMFADNVGGQSLPTNYNPSSGGYGFTSGTSNDSAQENPFSPYIDKLLGNFKTNDQWDGKKIGNFGEGLMGLYGGYKQRQMASRLMRGMNNRRNDYEVNLRNELMRKDAQSGRRSNYDGRAVQLQSGLAQLDAQQMPMMAQLSNSSLGGLFNMLKSGYSTANSMGAFSPAQQQPVASNGVPFLPSLYQQPMQPQSYSLGTDASLGDSSGGNPFTVRPRNKLFGGS
jgi:hypothetical protein